MKLHEIAPPKGARKKRKRLGIGPASGHGGTCCKGSKGQRCRSGSKHYAWFEGGQMPLQRRVPKRGMTSRNRKVYQIVNIKALNRFEDGAIVDATQMKKKGLVKKENLPIKILGIGQLSKNLTVKADKFSKKATEIIISRGGKAKVSGA
ncbi:MAG: 50S ribosomal protein L15 [Candidatus Cloacimonadota bacterium]|nr:MAG: 50S ribosomal protein L15 [Candidatus Cloacimonadota bacterium]